MTRSLILGAGPIGTHVADALLRDGEDVTLATRSGTTHPGTTAVTADALDAASLIPHLDGAQTLYVCTNPPYPEWATIWPAITDAILEAARATGADIVMTGNLYGYGPMTARMTEDAPLASTEMKGRVRAEMWHRLKEASDRGDVRATEVRGSDYFGAAPTASAHIGARFFDPLLAGKTAWQVGRTRQPHSWTYLPDFAETLVTAARSDVAWGRPWLAPNSSELPRTELAARINAIAGSTGRTRDIPPIGLALAAATNPFMRELRKMAYQFNEPFLVDSTVTERTLGVAATPEKEAIEAAVAFAQQRARETAVAA